jgi:hypothetical protein
MGCDSIDIPNDGAFGSVGATYPQIPTPYDNYDH